MDKDLSPLLPYLCIRSKIRRKKIVGIKFLSSTLKITTSTKNKYWYLYIVIKLRVILGPSEVHGPVKSPPVLLFQLWKSLCMLFISAFLSATGLVKTTKGYTGFKDWKNAAVSWDGVSWTSNNKVIKQVNPSSSAPCFCSSLHTPAARLYRVQNSLYPSAAGRWRREIVFVAFCRVSSLHGPVEEPTEHQSRWEGRGRQREDFLLSGAWQAIASAQLFTKLQP